MKMKSEVESEQDMMWSGGESGPVFAVKNDPVSSQNGRIRDKRVTEP